MLDHPIIQKTFNGAQYLMSRYRDDRCSEIAAALVYMSLFALVPLLTVVYAIGSAVPTAANLEHQLEQFLVENLLPESSSEVVGYLSGFSDQAKNLTGVGILILTITAVLMLRNVERAFNNIWRNRENRSPISSLLLYWAVLSLAPILLGLGLGVQAYLYAAANAIAGVDSLGVSAFLLSLLPFVLSVFGISALYVAVPNCAVPFRHALIGGIATAVAFSIAKAGFTTVMANSSYTLVYGAFAAVPVFLLWLYITWNIVLLGGVLVHSLSAYQSDEQANRPVLLKALDVLFLLWRAQKVGEPIRELSLIRDRQVVIGGLDSESWRFIRDRLMTAKLITQNSQGRYLLTRALSDVTLIDIKELINGELDIPRAPNSALSWQKQASSLLAQQRDDQRELLAVPLTELFQRDDDAEVVLATDEDDE